MSDIHDTRFGPMWFTFHVSEDGFLDVTGTPVGDAMAEVYRLSGAYHFEGNQLVSPAINEGRPVSVRLEGDELVLTIDDSLWFRLRRDPSR